MVEIASVAEFTLSSVEGLPRNDNGQKNLRIALECGKKTQSVERKSTRQAWIALDRPALITEILFSSSVVSLFCDER
jgi:hypothetical protein